MDAFKAKKTANRVSTLLNCGSFRLNWKFFLSFISFQGHSVAAAVEKKEDILRWVIVGHWRGFICDKNSIIRSTEDTVKVKQGADRFSASAGEKRSSDPAESEIINKKKTRPKSQMRTFDLSLSAARGYRPHSFFTPEGHDHDVGLWRFQAEEVISVPHADTERKKCIIDTFQKPLTIYLKLVVRDFSDIKVACVSENRNTPTDRPQVREREREAENLTALSSFSL